MNRAFNSLKTFYHKLGSSPWFYRISEITIPYVALFSFLFLSIGIVWGVFFLQQTLNKEMFTELSICMCLRPQYLNLFITP